MYALPVPRFDSFYRYSELSRLLFDYADALPNLISVRSLGKSHEGRDVWVAAVTNIATGVDTDKPALWIEGNLHAAELTASTACLHYLHQLLSLYGTSREITQLLDTRCVYICPRLNPDGAEGALSPRQRHPRAATRQFPFDEEPLEGLSVEDVDGDGRILTMRLRDPHGGYKQHATEPRLMVAREPGEFGGDYYRLIPEGTLAHWDGLTLNVNESPEGLDLNRNFSGQQRPGVAQPGAGPYPPSEPEVHAMVEFFSAHRNIGAVVGFHTHGGVILGPMGSRSDDDTTREDRWAYQRLSALGEQLTGYPAISTRGGVPQDPKTVLNDAPDWRYEHLGALFWAVELWAPTRAAGVADSDGAHGYREHPVADALALLKWSDEQCAGQAYVDWQPFMHPQLGMVEIGGWDKMNFWRNPPPALRESEVARFPAWLTQIALSLPRLEPLRVEVRALGADTWRIRFAVANGGWLPAAVTQRAIERQSVRGLIFEIHLPDTPEVSLASGKPRFEGPHLEGHAAKTSQLAPLPSRELTADRAVAEWVVRAPRGTRLALTARADRAGVVRSEVTLD